MGKRVNKTRTINGKTYVIGRPSDYEPKSEDERAEKSKHEYRMEVWREGYER